MKKKSLSLFEIIQVISCFALFAYVGSSVSVGFATTAKAADMVAPIEVTKQKQDLWQRWLEAMARNELSKALDVVQGDRTLAEAVASEVGNYGVELFKKGDINGALAVFHPLVPFYRQLDDLQGEATTEQNIGSAYLKSGDCKRALNAFGRAAEHYEKNGNQSGREKAANGLGACVRAVAIPDKSLGGIANLHSSPEMGEVIVVHPDRCQQIGSEVCEFYQLHEFAHIYLGHVGENKPWEEGEIEADCWAAKYGRRTSAMATYEWLLNASPRISPLSHKTNELRAERIRACARF